MSVTEPFLAFYGPIRLITLTICFLPITIFKIINESALPNSYSAFKAKWFATFWSWYGPLSRNFMAPVVRPLLSHATGTILDIGPGQGHFLSLYDLTNIKTVFAIEPNRSHHPKLRQNAKLAGFTEGTNFIILDCLIETLESTGNIPRYSVDTIVTLQVLCSIPNPQILIPELRTYLRPQGGKWIASEHVARPSSATDPSLRNRFVMTYQNALNTVWPQFFNGCHLDRKSAQWIEATGGWEEGSDGKVIGLNRMRGDSEWSVLPTMCGVLTTK